MIEFLIYIADVFDNISLACTVVFIIFTIVLSLRFIGCMLDSTEFKLNISNFSKCILVASVIIMSFIPSSKTVYLIMGAGYLKSSALPQKVSLVIEKKLDEMLGTKEKK